MAGNQRLDVREYIGARYVPLFYDNGQGSAEWDSSVEYEPLTIVLYQGNSYTSRQFVPAGIAITNTRYWLQTGNWNSQIEEYRREVQDYSDRITAAQETADAAQDAVETETKIRLGADSALSDRIFENSAAIARIDTSLANLGRINNVVAIGDSWADGWNGDATITSWITHMKNYAGLVTVREQHEGGAGFYRGGNATGRTFTGLLQDAINAISPAERGAVQVVIALGGVNDRSATFAQIENGVRTFCQMARDNFPNAKILIACGSAVNMASDQWGSLRTLRAYTMCSKYGACYITNSEYLPFLGTFASDGAHLLDYSMIGAGMAQALYTGSVDVQVNTEVRFLTTGGQDIDMHPTVNVFISNDTATIALQNHRWSGLPQVTLNWDTNTLIGTWECDNPLVRGFGFEGTCAALAHVYGGAWVGGTAVLQLSASGNVNVRFMNANGITLANVNEFCIAGGWISQESILA